MSFILLFFSYIYIPSLCPLHLLFLFCLSFAQIYCHFPSSFQMFVRLFVDENLDRMVPISKQPKEKIQAIIESCSRQFPEFQERARKRIRTYLKSCRRMKKGGFEVQKYLCGLKEVVHKDRHFFGYLDVFMTKYRPNMNLL